MGLPDALRTSADMIDKVGEALSWISHLTTTTADDKALVVLRLIGATIEAMLDDLGIKIDPDVVQHHLDAVKAKIAADDATIDQEIAEKVDRIP